MPSLEERRGYITDSLSLETSDISIPQWGLQGQLPSDYVDVSPTFAKVKPPPLVASPPSLPFSPHPHPILVFITLSRFGHASPFHIAHGARTESHPAVERFMHSRATWRTKWVATGRTETRRRAVFLSYPTASSLM
jgi:hypothetical protein